MEPEQLQKLIGELKNGDDRQRRAASYKLSKSKDTLAAQALMEAIHDPDSSVRDNVIAGLRAIKSQETREFLASNQIPEAEPSKPTDAFGGVVAGLLILVIGGLLVMCAEIVLSSHATLINEAKQRLAAPDMQMLGKQLLEFLAVFMVGVFNFILGSLFRVADPAFRRSATAWELLLGRWGASASAAIVVLLVAANQPTGIASVGIRSEPGAGNQGAALTGLYALFGLFVAYRLIWRYILRKPIPDGTSKLDISKAHIAEVLLYRNRWQRLAHILETSVAVITEDLIFRGYLVLLLGHRTGSYIPWAILSVVLSVIIHLYQGTDRGTIAFHAVAASFFVALTIITQNLLAPIAAHLFYDLWWPVGIWRQASKQGELPPVPQAGLKEKLAYGVFIGANLTLLGGALLWIGI